MELGRVVIQDQPRRLLKMFRLELHPRRRREAEVLLPAGDQRLFELTAQAFAAEQPQETRTLGQTPDALRIRRAQPLKIDRKLRRIELLAVGCGERVSRQARRQQP